MKHALVIGGSGMLAQASLWLANNGYFVSVIGRNMQKLNRLCEKSDYMIPISVDYYDEHLLTDKIKQSIKVHGPYDLVIAWIHSHEKQIIQWVSNEINQANNDVWRLFHVLGSSSNIEHMMQEMIDLEKGRYHQIQLGFIIEGQHSRWLTHEEISSGVIKSVRENLKQHLIGTLTPWHMRP